MMNTKGCTKWIWSENKKFTWVEGFKWDEMVCKKVNISVLLFINVLGSQIYRKTIQAPKTRQKALNQTSFIWSIM